jgi:Gluconate 2-dehydrogenase subunit 3
MTDHLTMNRRALMANMALLLGAAALPAEAFAAPAARARKFLTPPQFALLSAVADTIMPKTDSVGALEAGVPAKLDGMLKTWASPATRTQVVAALGRIDAAAKAQTKKPFALLAAADRAALLKPYDAAALKKVPPPPGTPPANFFVRPTFVADQGYYVIKDLVLDLYYFSEAATTSELVYEHVPGKFEPSIKLTPTSRPYLSTGPF